MYCRFQLTILESLWHESKGVMASPQFIEPGRPASQRTGRRGNMINIMALINFRNWNSGGLSQCFRPADRTHLQSMSYDTKVDKVKRQYGTRRSSPLEKQHFLLFRDRQRRAQCSPDSSRCGFMLMLTVRRTLYAADQVQGSSRPPFGAPSEEREHDRR